MSERRWTIRVCSEAGCDFWTSTSHQKVHMADNPENWRGKMVPHQLENLELVSLASLEEVERRETELREALEFYADEGNHLPQARRAPVTGERYGAASKVRMDNGSLARQALENTEVPTALDDEPSAPDLPRRDEGSRAGP